MTNAQSERREALSNTPDARALETRRRLGRALREQLLESRDVSVVAIATRAGVGRSTFYTHFATVEDLAVFMVDEIVEALAPLDVERRSHRELSRSDITRRGLEELVDNLAAEREVLIHATRTASGAAMRERFVMELAKSMEQTIRTELPKIDDTSLRMSAQFVAAGVMHVVISWLSDPADATRQQVLDALFEILPAWLTRD